jgi:hypothetical protein
MSRSVKPLTGLLVACSFVAMTLSVTARWKAEYAQLPQSVRDWYKAQELTPAAQEVWHFKSCCERSDVVRTKFRVNKIDGKDEWWWLDNEREKWRLIPDYVVHWGQSAPDGQPTLFALEGMPTCFFPGEAGI